MSDGTKRGELSAFGKKAAQAERKQAQAKSFRRNAGEPFTPSGEQQAILWQIVDVVWRAGGTLTLGRTQRGDAMSLRVWRAGEQPIQDYLTNEDDFSEWLESLKDELGVD